MWISSDENPANKKRIAYSLSWTAPREWHKHATQKSIQVYLEVGKKYYVEALHKEGAGGDNLAVAWQLPDGSMEAPIPGVRLLPFEQPLLLLTHSAPFAPIEVTDAVVDNTDLSVYPNPFANVATVRLNTKEAEMMSLDVRDMQGRIVKNLYKGLVEKGVKTFTLNNTGLSAGAYIISITSKRKTISKRIVLIKG